MIGRKIRSRSPDSKGAGGSELAGAFAFLAVGSSSSTIQNVTEVREAETGG